MKNIIFSAAFAASLLSSSVAQAVVISYGSANATDGSGKTSQLAGQSNVYVETFDRADGTGGLTLGSSIVNVTTVSGGGFGYAKGNSSGVYAAPANDGTHFVYGPDANSGSSSAKVNFNYAPLLAQKGADASLNYFGLYYGSIDTFNDVTFYNAAGSVIQTITGSQLITQFNGVSGGQNADSSNIYVNLFFNTAEQFTSFSFNTTSRAFEADNLVVGYEVEQPVPEPASLALLGLGLLGLGAARRRNKN